MLLVGSWHGRIWQPLEWPRIKIYIMPFRRVWFMHYPLTDQRLLPASMVSRYVCVLSPDQDGYLVQGTECFTMFAPCFSIDMFHTRLCTSPDLDACRAPKCFTVTRYVSQYVCFTICFTIYLFIGPDLDGYRAPQKALTLQDPQGLETQILLTTDRVSRYVCSLVRT